MFYYTSIPCDVAKALNDARMKYGVESFTFDELQECWKTHTWDRRYKLWFCAATRNSYIMRVGKSEIYVLFRTDGVYARLISDSNKYEHLNCWKIEYLYDYDMNVHDWTYHYVTTYQSEVKI